ncbi:MAG: stage sporulation protein cell division protein FtsW [Candidatus Parcubacteria bacterium]|jgi:cell division protein FtsW
MRRAGVDKTLVLLIAILVIGGGLIFASAAFGILARGGVSIASVAFGHVVLGIGAGSFLLVCGALIDYRRWRPIAPYFFGLALLATAAVFIPHLGASHGGGRRWLILAGMSFQPSELLKLATIIMAAAYFATIRERAASILWGACGFLALLLLPGLILLLQPDMGTLGVICASIAAIFFSAGARWRDIALIIIIALLALGALAFERPYVRDRVMTFFYPSEGRLAEGYQIRQSLIAIGSGGLTGRGFGQSVQKFTYLPEPMGDSIFAVASEELGFVGSVGIVGLFLFLALRGFVVAARTHDAFGGLLAVGISTYLVSEAFINISSMLGLAPLTGIPLTFVSQGGSAMLVSLASAGILLNVSRSRHR